VIAGLDGFQLTGIELFEEMNVTVKFLGDLVRNIAVRQKF